MAFIRQMDSLRLTTRTSVSRERDSIECWRDEDVGLVTLAEIMPYIFMAS